ncbi:MAG: HAD hydrolase family protein [Bacilli bacterium]|nr:HAD hydrolase family protein [Bacilli bacterium]
MTIKIAFFDIDETIYDGKVKNFAEDAIRSIKQIQANGIKVCLCSSRPNDSIRHLGCHGQGIVWDAIIGSGGGTAMVGDKPVRLFTIQQDIAERFFSYCNDKGYVFEMIGIQDRHVNKELNECGREFYTRFIDKEPVISNKLYENLTQFHLFHTDEHDEEIIKAFPDLCFCRYCWFAVDIVPVVYRKGDAIEDVLKYFGYSKDEAVGFGDDLQDLSIAENVGTFVAMGNAKDEVKAAAQLITTNIDDNGIENALRKLGLIE